jgi:fucose 4-O-acetylase-like acetyltransferase
VICAHAGLIVDGQTTASAQLVQYALNFRVPFFLITAFYFALAINPTTSLRAWWTKRASRLLVPYAAWSIIYLLARAAMLAATHQTPELHTLFQDPVGLVFINGGGSIALYFLPLVFTGLVLTQCLNKPLKSAPSWALLLVLVLSAGCLHLLLQSNNAFNLASSEAFQAAFPNQSKTSLVRLSLVFAAHTITCLPHIVAAKLLKRYSSVLDSKDIILLLIGLALLVVSFTHVGSLTPLSPHLRGVGALLLALYLSRYVPSNQFIKVLGATSFGIYLVHQLVLQIIEVTAKQLHLDLSPINAVMLTGISILTFLISLLIVSIASRGALPLRRAFGVI